MAEIERGAPSRLCLEWRIVHSAMLATKMAISGAERGADATTFDWHDITADARMHRTQLDLIQLPVTKQRSAR